MVQAGRPVSGADPPPLLRAGEEDDRLTTVLEPLPGPSGEGTLLGQHVVDLSARRVVTAAHRLDDPEAGVSRGRAVVAEEEKAPPQEQVIVAAERGIAEALEGALMAQEEVHDPLKAAERDQGV